jgi:hypothetical protein
MVHQKTEASAKGTNQLIHDLKLKVALLQGSQATQSDLNTIKIEASNSYSQLESKLKSHLTNTNFQTEI